MQHIETIELGSSQSSITFSSIPQDGTDLIIFTSERIDASPTSTKIFLNGDTGTTNYSDIRLVGNGSSASSSSISTESRISIPSGSSDTANTFGSSRVVISNYTASQNKSISADYVSENNATTAFQGINAALYTDTTAVTSVTITAGGSNNFVSGSTFSLYTLTAGGDGTVTTS